MIRAISQVCVLGSAFATDLAEFKEAGFDHVECWVTKLETHLESNPLESIPRLLAEHQIRMPVASLQGGLLSAVDHQNDAAWQLLRRRLSLLSKVGCNTLVVTADLAYPLEAVDIDRTMGNLMTAVALAEQAGIRLSLEFQARSAFISNLQTAVAVVERIGSPFLGVCLDTFHFQVGPSKHSDLELLTAANLNHVQVADVADRPREFASDGDRILPADGEIVWLPIAQRLREISYSGLVSLEIMNPRFAQISALQLANIGQLALNRILQ